MSLAGRSSSLQPDERMEAESRRGSFSSVRSADSRPGKRARTSDLIEGEEKDVILGRMKLVGAALRSFVCDDSSKVSKASGKFIMDKAAEYEELLVQVLLMNERVVGRLEEMRDAAKLNMETTTAIRPQYADIAARNAVTSAGGSRLPPAAPRPANPKTFALVVRAKDDKVSAENVKSKLLKEVQPEIGKAVKVKALRVVRNGGVAIEVTSEHDRNIIKSCRKFEEAGLNVNEPKKIGPKVIIYDVPKDIDEGAFMKELYERNLRDLMNEEEMKERVRVVRRNGKKDSGLLNVVLELTMKAREHLLKQGRIYIDWSSYRVNSFELVMRCFKCYGFGHRIHECKEKESTCRRCGKKGHISGACKETEVSCGFCRARGQDHGHSMTSEGCPEVERALARQRNRIDDD